MIRLACLVVVTVAAFAGAALWLERPRGVEAPRGASGADAGPAPPPVPGLLETAVAKVAQKVPPAVDEPLAAAGEAARALVERGPPPDRGPELVEEVVEDLSSRPFVEGVVEGSAGSEAPAAPPGESEGAPQPPGEDAPVALFAETLDPDASAELIRRLLSVYAEVGAGE